MPRRIVAMAAIPGRIVRGAVIRSNVGYRRFGQATWEWWCRKNGVTFVLLDQPLGGEAYSHLPPTMQRWLAPGLLRQEFGSDIEIAMVDADTMIRWDAPNLFDEAAGRLGGVRDGASRWIDKANKGFAPYFPGVSLPWWEHVNAGMVTMSGRHAEVMTEFVDFVRLRWEEMSRVIAAEDIGTDQPLLNLYLKMTGEEVHLLPPCFNMLYCVNISPWEAVLAGSSEEETVRVFSSDWLYDFFDLAWVWHFTNVVKERERAMGEAWERIRSHYPGATTQ